MAAISSASLRRTSFARKASVWSTTSSEVARSSSQFAAVSYSDREAADRAGVDLVFP